MGLEINSYEEILRKVLEEYDRNPKGWHVLLTKSQGIGYDLYILRPNRTMAMVKLESIYRPKPVGVGIEMIDEIKGLREVLEQTSKPFGFRPIPTKMAVKILKSLEEDIPLSTDLIIKMMEKEPIPQKEIKTPLALQGPILQLPRPLPPNYASVQQIELQSRLARQLQRLIQERYGHPYVG